MMESFVDRLRTACDATESLVCVGLDVNPDKIPDSVFAGDRENPRHRARACVKFNKAIVDATRDLVCAYKPNLAFYEAEGVYGILALQNTIKYIRQVAPKAVIIGDSKMGDIGETATAYAKAMFDVLQVDAVTINAWVVKILRLRGLKNQNEARSSGVGARIRGRQISKISRFTTKRDPWSVYMSEWRAYRRIGQSITIWGL